MLSAHIQRRIMNSRRTEIHAFSRSYLLTSRILGWNSAINRSAARSVAMGLRSISANRENKSADTAVKPVARKINRIEVFLFNVTVEVGAWLLSIGFFAASIWLIKNLFD